MTEISPVLGYTVIYDAHCGVCSRSVAWLRRQRADQELRFLPADSEEAIRFIHPPGYSYFVMLREKLRWSESLDKAPPAR